MTDTMMPRTRTARFAREYLRFLPPGTLVRAFLDVNPVSHRVTAERTLTSGTATASQVGWVLAASAALIAVFGPLTMYLYRASLGER